jgi:hypothetical protein
MRENMISILEWEAFQKLPSLQYLFDRMCSMCVASLRAIRGLSLNALTVFYESFPEGLDSVRLLYVRQYRVSPLP